MSWREPASQVPYYARVTCLSTVIERTVRSQNRHLQERDIRQLWRKIYQPWNQGLFRLGCRQGTSSLGHLRSFLEGCQYLKSLSWNQEMWLQPQQNLEAHALFILDLKISLSMSLDMKEGFLCLFWFLGLTFQLRPLNSR